MNTLQLIARAVGEKIALVYARLKTHTAEKNIHRTSAEIRAEITDADIPAGIARDEDMRRQLAGKTDKVPGKELMPSPGAQPLGNHFLNEQGEYIRIEAGSVILDMQMGADASTFTVSRKQLSEYVERAIIGGEPGLNVYFKHQGRPFSYKCYKVTDITFEYTTYWLTAYTNRQSEDQAEKDMVRHFTYSFIYDATQPEPLLPNKGVVIDSPYYITTYIDRALGGKADAGTVKTHLDNTAIHRTSAEIRADITDADIPPSIARDAEVDAKISVHNDAGNVHPGLRNSIANLENGATPAGRSEYAQKLGDTNGSYTKTQLDTCLSGLIRDVTYDSATAKFTFWFPDGHTIEIDTPLENTVKDGRYDTATASLVLVLVSGQEISIPAAGLTKIYTGKDTPTATTTVSAAGEIAVALKQGTIDSVHLSSALQTAINSHLTLTGDTRDNIATFADQPTRVNLASGDKHTLLFGKIKRWFSDLGALAFLNKVSKTDMDTALQGELNGKEPGFTKNTAFNKNFGTAAGTVCQGNDARLSDARTANDVSAWAKANAKPSYTANEIGAASVSIYAAPGGSSVDTIPYNLSNLTSVHVPGTEYSGVITIQDFIGTRLQLKLKDYAGDVSVLFRGETTKSWKKIAFTSDIPASLPANGGNADTVGGLSSASLFIKNRGGIQMANIDNFVSRESGTYQVDYGGGTNMLTVFKSGGSSSALEILHSYAMDSGAIRVRSTIDSNRYSPWKTLAFVSDIPASLPANGGNAHTVDGLHAAAAGVVEGGKLASYNNAGYFDATIFRDTFPTQDAEPIGLVAYKISQVDGYHRFCSLARFKSVLGNMPPSAHTHPKSQITDFPASLPANGGIAAKLYQGGNTNSQQMVFNWSGQAGQPTWLWGGSDGTNMYVYNPANFSVTNSANLGGVAAGNFARRDVANTFTAYCDFRAGGGNSGSDMRFKREIIPVENILTALLTLNVIQYTWDKEGETRRNTFGLSASQLLEKGGVFGKIVHERGDEGATQWVEYDRVGVLALKGLQEIARKTEDENAMLRQELNSLRQEMAALREHVQSLKNMILR